MIPGGLADDLTGGLELAAMLVAQGVPSLLVTSARAVHPVGGAQAVIVAQKTRIAPAADACALVDAAAEVLQAVGTRQLFFKYCAIFDSTDSGNIGQCIEVLMRRTGSHFTACCPTFPDYQRAVFQGHLFVADRLVSESPKRNDPVTPMRDPDLVRVLQRQTGQLVGLIGHVDVRAGVAAITQRVAALQAASVACAIADAALHDDLQHLAAATVDWPLMTGGSSIAAHYPPLWRERGWLSAAGAAVSLPRVAGPGVVLAGSCAEPTRRQLAHFALGHPTLALDLEAYSLGHDVVGAALAWAAAHHSHQPVALSTSDEPAAVERLQSRLGVAAAAALAEQLLGRIAAGLQDAGVRRFVVAGGETSGAVLDHLGVERLRVGPFAGQSLPLALADGGDTADPLMFCLKSGKLGPIDAFSVALAAMAAGVHPTAEPAP